MKKIIIIILSISILWLLWCSKSSKIQIWDIVTFSYTGTLENWEIFENWNKTITIWSLETIKAIEEALINKKINQNFKLNVDPEKWYWNKYSIYNQQRISAFVFERLWLPIETGSIVTLDKTTGKIINHETDEQWNTFIVFDINPPQTRQKTKYEIHIDNIEKPQQAWEWYVL